MDRRLDPEVRRHYEVHDFRHALAVLASDFAEEWADIMAVLRGFRLQERDVRAKGGRKSPVADALDGEFARRGWVEKAFETSVRIDGQDRENPTHKIDCYKNRVALEIEWNNKDPFFDRDLNNFRVLFELGAISVGAIVTRTDALQAVFDGLGKGPSYGASTTHMSKLLPRIRGGGAGGCPVVVFGIRDSLYVPAGTRREREGS